MPVHEVVGMMSETVAAEPAKPSASVLACSPADRWARGSCSVRLVEDGSSAGREINAGVLAGGLGQWHYGR